MLSRGSMSPQCGWHAASPPCYKRTIIRHCKIKKKKKKLCKCKLCCAASAHNRGKSDGKVFPISCHTGMLGSSSSPTAHSNCWLPRNLGTSKPFVMRTWQPISFSNDYCCFKVCLKCVNMPPPAEMLTFPLASAAPGRAAILLNDAPPSCGDAGGDDTTVRCPLKAGHN